MKPSPLTRRCTSCGDEHMVAVKRRWTGFGYEDDYECPSCSYKVALTQPGLVGLQILVWILGSSIFSWFWVIGNRFADFFDYGFVVFIWLIGAFSCLPEAWQLRVHRATGFIPTATSLDETETTNPSNFSQATSRVFSRFGALLMPVIAILGIIGILAIAALIGYVKDYVL